MPVHTYTNWNQRPSDQEEQIEPFRKYFFICEGANTEIFYFKHLIDLRKELGIHPLIDIRLWEKTKEDKNMVALSVQGKSWFRKLIPLLPLEMIRYYSAKAGLDCRIADEGPIGIPLQVYYPDISSALEISPLFQRPSRKWENAKNWLCINAGICLVRILNAKDDEYTNCICITREDDSEETLGLAISEAFRQLGVSVIIDMKDWLFYHNTAVLE